MWRKRRARADENERVVSDVEHARERTMNRALKLLAAKPRSVAELRGRLLEKPWTNSEIVEAVLDKLREYKYLDDEQFAQDLALSKLRQKPQGRRRLRQTLGQKKLDKSTVEQAIDTAFEKLSETDLIDQAIETRVRQKGIPRTRDELKKFHDHLLRRGFGYDLVGEKLRDLGRFRDDTSI